MPSNAAPRSATHYVAPIEETPLQAVDQVDETEKTRSTWTDAWESMRGRPTFWISSILILLVLVVAIFPGLFTHVDPRAANLDFSDEGARPGHPLGYNRQGYDVYARVIWGARSSVIVGLVATILVSLVGIIIGALAGFYGGWLDTIVSRIGDIFFSIPYILAAIVVMSVFSQYRNVFTLALAIGGFAWASTARVVRAEVLRVRQADYVTASRALGQSRFRTLLSHVIPNAIAPLLVVTTISLAAAIVAEATLSFLGVGLGGSTMSWGNDISQAQQSLRVAPMALIWPSIALTVTVLAFILLGELIRDAIDPRARARR